MLSQTILDEAANLPPRNDWSVKAKLLLVFE